MCEGAVVDEHINTLLQRAERIESFTLTLDGQ